MRGDRLPHPLEDSDYQIPFPRDGQDAKCPGGECWSFDLTDKLNNIKRFKEPKFVQNVSCTIHNMYTISLIWAVPNHFKTE